MTSQDEKAGGNYRRVWPCQSIMNNQDKQDKLMVGFPYTPTEYNYQNAFRNLVCNVNRRNCFSIRFGNSMFA